jgi:CBS domain containing-hemolysin-like protein
MTSEHVLDLVLLAASFGMLVFFTAAEAAFVAANRMVLRTAATAGNQRAAIADRLVESRERLVSDLLIGINTFTVASSVLVASLTEDLLGPQYIGLAAAAMVVVVLIFAEMLPKAISYADPTAAALRLAPVVAVASAVLRPVTVVLGLIPRWIAGRVAEDEDDLDVTEESLSELMRLGEEQGGLAPDTGEVVSGILASQDQTVSNVMIPLADAALAPSTTPLRSLAAMMSRTGFSRIPIYQTDRKAIVGVVHVKDVFARLYRGGGGTAIDLIRPILRTTPGRTAVDLLGDMRAGRQHIAVVEGIDGAASGLVTIQDLLEDIVGEVMEQPSGSGSAGAWLE